MFTRWNTVDDVFNVQREVERLFTNFWGDLPSTTAAGRSPSFQVKTTDDGWRIDIPLPGVDPTHVAVDAAGREITIRAEEPADKDTEAVRYEQTFTVPSFLDLEKMRASHYHGMLRLTIPLTERVKPRRIQIEAPSRDQKQLQAVAS